MTGDAASCLVRVRVTPRSGRDEVLGWLDGELRIRVRAAPVEGRANDAVCRLIAKQAGVPHSAVELVSGGGSRRKTLRITGVSDEDVRTRLTP